MRDEDFVRIAEETLARLPRPFRDRLENVEVAVEDEPTREDRSRAGVPPGDELLGLYLGVPLTRRESFFALPRPPDRILLFRGPLERAARGPEDLVRQIRWTLLHEIGHHLGLEEEELRRLEREVMPPGEA